MDERLTRLLERVENRHFGKYRGTVVDRRTRSSSAG